MQTYPFQRIVRIVAGCRERILWSKPVIHIHSNASQPSECPTQQSLIVQSSEYKASPMVYDEYGTSILWQGLRFVNAYCNGSAITDLNLSVFFHISGISRSLIRSYRRLPLCMSKSSNFRMVGIVIEVADVGRLLQDLQ